MPEAVTAQSSKTIQGWEHFSHMADIGVRGYGGTAATAFEEAAVALTAVICDPTTVKPQERVLLKCRADDIELLFVDWLNALIYSMATRKVLFSRFKVEIDLPLLKSAAWGEAIDRQRHEPSIEIKGATYTALKVKEANGIWIAQCVVDV